jgi:hypothetical protein
MDPEWHPAHVELRSRPVRGTHVAVFTVPFPYMTTYAESYGRERSAIFLSPNTDTLGGQYARTAEAFGLLMAPSAWCAAVADRGIKGTPDIAVLPLGVSHEYAATRNSRMANVRFRAGLGDAPRVLHLTTDQAWPGRKGTEELLAAWAILADTGRLGGPRLGARLTVHVPPAMRPVVMFRCRDLKIDDTVDVVSGSLLGTDDAPLTNLFDEVDLMVAPSRCEGFGMMLLASLVSGVPMVCTYNTGHSDFLTGAPGWLGVPCATADDLHGEDGKAPTVEPAVLAETLAVAMQPSVRLALVKRVTAQEPGWGTWEDAGPQWADRLAEWIGETT